MPHYSGHNTFWVNLKAMQIKQVRDFNNFNKYHQVKVTNSAEPKSGWDF